VKVTVEGDEKGQAHWRSEVSNAIDTGDAATAVGLCIRALLGYSYEKESIVDAMAEEVRRADELKKAGDGN
jgi:hypothetical protein